MLYLLEASRANIFVQYVDDVASWLTGWSQAIFTMENKQLRLGLGYGLPAVVYLLVGHGIAVKIRRG